MKLHQSPTKFIAPTHQYFNADGIELSGITSAIKRVLFPNKYAGIDPETLRAAAAYGTSVHEDIQAWEADQQSPLFTQEGNAYRDIRPENLAYVEQEYLVSNETTHASKIDLVFTSDDGQTATLADIKCNANLDTEYLSWQLSTYACLFELQNPTIKVSRLLGIWMPRRDKYPDKQPKFVDIERKSDQAIIEFLAADLQAQAEAKEEAAPAHTAPAVTTTQLPAEVADALRGVEQLLREEAAIAERKKSLQEQLLALCERHGIKKWDNDIFALTYVAPTTRTAVDTKRLAELHPDIYQALLRTSEVKSSIRLKLK